VSPLRRLAARAAVQLEAAIRESNHEEIAVLLPAHGDELVYAGRVRLVADAGRLLRDTPEHPDTAASVGLALGILGDTDEAARLLHTPDTFSARHAWRLGMLHHLDGSPDEALDVMRRPTGCRIANTEDDALLLSWSAAASWMLGDAGGCGHFAEQAHRVAMACGGDVAMAAAQSSLALDAALTGDRRRNAWHWHRALDAARRAGDVLQEIRIRTNLGSHQLEEGRYAAATDDLAAAAQLAERVDFLAMHALSSNNLGECLLHLGRLDEAVVAFDAARASWQRTGSRMIAYALTGLGDCYRERDELVLAKAAYEEAVQVSQGCDPQGLVPALDGLARVISAEDPDQALALATRAEKYARGMERSRVRLTIGWLRLASRACDEAATIGREVVDEAQRRRDHASLGEALELQAMSSDSAARLRLLNEAAAVWQHSDDVPGVRRVAHAIERLTPRGPGEPRCGADTNHRPAAAGLRAAVNAATGPSVEVRVLGRFEVLRDGVPVGDSAWQSRKARDLLRVLVAQRGRPIGRESLIDLLWPDEDSAQLANRLSVTLAVIRRVLDPERTHPACHFVRTDDGVVAIDYEHLVVDVEEFLHGVAAGLGCKETDPVAARQRLWRALELYAGDTLAEDLYAEWAAPLRNEAAAAHVAASRALAELTLDDDPSAAVPHLMRVLRQDAYDEPTHLLLVGAFHRLGSFGAARDAYRAYTGKMRELGLPARPAPAVQGG
jgi:DNA-binding SARP family transcriptional activator/tetratricopeptide (TPR) repeat protein